MDKLSIPKDTVTCYQYYYNILQFVWVIYFGTTDGAQNNLADKDKILTFYMIIFGPLMIIIGIVDHKKKQVSDFD